ncbi:unnamed protein product [Arabidopsis lyrata]|nr:unnamed protein product [Arabidopsis lyrata]
MKEPIPSPPLQSQSRTAAFIPTKNSKSQITPSPNPSLHPNHRTVAPSGNSASPFSSSPNCIGSPEERDFSTLSHRSMGWSLGRRRGVGGQYRERRRFGGDGSVHIESYHKHLNGRRFSTAPVGHAIMVAATDCPNKFKSRGDKIAELLFSCRVSRCIGCDHLELSIHGDDEANRGRGTTGDGGGGTAVDEDYEPNSVLLDSLRHLKLMSLNVDILKVGFLVDSV